MSTRRRARARSGPDRLPAALAVDHLLLRRADPADAEAVTEAVNGSLRDLAPWMGWARRPARLEETTLRLAMAGASFDAGGHAEWTVLATGGRPGAAAGAWGQPPAEEATVVGACGLYQTPESDCRQIGYWVRTGWTGQGVASRSAAAMTWAAFTVLRLERVEIRCDVGNVRSAAVARRLGFTLLGTVTGDTATAIATGRCEVWGMAREGWAASAAAGWAVERR